MIRICLIAAVVLGLAVAGLNLVVVRDKINILLADRDNEKHIKEVTMDSLAKTNKILVKTIKELTTTKQDLAKTTDELTKSQAETADLTKRAEGLSESLKKTQGERDSAQNELAAWKALGVPLESIKATLASLKTVKEERDAILQEKNILFANYTRIKTELDYLTNPEHVPELPAGLKGKVLVADPKYEFVVLDIGKNQGVLKYGQMLVNRNGKLIAKVQIRSVDTDRSIANVMPGWRLSDVMEGDQVLY
jgi:cell shape-determining protein MreC